VLDKLRTAPNNEDAKAEQKTESNVAGTETTKDVESNTTQTTDKTSEMNAVPTTSVPDSNKPKLDSTSSTPEGNSETKKQ